ncbi:MAG TPA: bifunctional diguanylate cyclase/phosphodiesterase [Candidatus Binatia bacterium]|jgi:diguanylate cyclase (GGDEF)-like protein
MTYIPIEIADNAQFQIQVRQAIRAAQHSSTQVGLLMIDIEAGEPSFRNGDGLSNDTKEKAFALVTGTLRESDALSRISGAEIAVLLSSLRNPADALLVAEKILRKLDQLLEQKSGGGNFRPKIGVALFPDHGSSATTLLECADIALKSARRNNERCVLYSEEFSRSARPPLRLSVLRQAIVQDQLFPLYQPKIDLKSDRIVGLEVLTRWRHPEYGLIMPDEFIPLAERTGLIVPLTLWVLNASINQCRRWRDQGIHTGIAVNLSMWNLDTPELPEQLAALLNSTGVSADQLELEITESAIMDDPHRAMRTLKAIRELGVRFAIDDFGTGYSSLAYLKKLPVSSIKIDKSFTQNMESDNDSAVIVRAIIDLGHNLGLKVVAEGVETLEAKEMLTDFDCDEAQGYYFSRPVSAPDIARFMQNAQTSSTQHSPIAGISSGWALENDGEIPPATKPPF